MPSLKLLSLNRTRVRGSGLSELAHLVGLDIYLEDCRIADKEIETSLSHLANLKRLSLSGTDVTDRGMKGITACRKLWDLRLNDTGVTDATVDLLEDLPELEVLYVERTSVTRDRIELLKERKPELTVYSDFTD